MALKERTKLIANGCWTKLESLAANRAYTKRYHLKPGDTVIDAGAFFGNFTAYASRKVGKKGKVIAYEPDPTNHRVLIRKVKRLGLTNVEVVCKGLFNKVSKLGFKSEMAQSRIAEDNKGAEIETTTLDQELTDRHLEKVDFLKADIEGAEVEMLEGVKYSTRKIKNMAIASYHERGGEKTADIVATKLREIGYKTEIGFPVHLTVWASRD